MSDPPDIRALYQNPDLGALFDAVPYARFLGLRFQMEGDALIVTMPGSDHLIGNPMLPALHGGSIGAVLESAAVFQLMWALPLAEVPKTVSLTIDFLRSGRVVDTHTRARIVKRGRRVVNVQVSAYQDDEARPIALAHAHLLVEHAE